MPTHSIINTSTQSSNSSGSGAPAAATATAARAPQVVTLCVGGALYTTTLSTLTAVPGSYLDVLLGSSSSWGPSSLLPDSQTPFIDRDGELFRFVLAYLRWVKDYCAAAGPPLLPLPDDPVQLQQLRAEADFYGLPGLAALCSQGRSRGQQQGGAWSRLTALQQQQVHHYHHLQQQQPQYRHTSSNGATHDGHEQQQQPPDASQPKSQPQQNGGPVSAGDVEIGLQAQPTSSNSGLCLAAAMLQAQQVLASQQQRWAEDTVLQGFASIVMKHLVHLPLAAQQPDLVQALACADAGSKLEFRFAYFPVGETRVDLQCRCLPSNAQHASAIAAAAAAGLAAGSGAASPDNSPRDSRYGVSQQPQQQYSTRRNTVSEGAVAAAGDAAAGGGGNSSISGGGGSSRAYSGSLSPEAAGLAAVAAAAAAAAAVNSYAGSAAAVPGPGWGAVTMYHRYVIKEASDKFVLTTHTPGEQQVVQELPHAAFGPELKRYSALHKLCVQQCPRSSVAGLVWLLEEAAGFSGVQLATSLETYYVGRNMFTGFASIITCSL